MKPMNEKHFAILHRHMAEVIGIHTDRLEEELGKGAFAEPMLEAMLRIPRHLFVPEALAQVAYQDTPLPLRITRFRCGRLRFHRRGCTSCLLPVCRPSTPSGHCVHRRINPQLDPRRPRAYTCAQRQIRLRQGFA